MACLFVASCSNDIVDKEEYPNWKATNEAFFSKTLSQAKTSIASGDNTWKVFRSWTLPGSRWEVYVPANLGFASSAIASIGIPEHSTIIYDITLLEINPKKSIR